MSSGSSKKVSPVMVVIAFATVYLVWGSTFFFIQKAVQHIPPFILGAFRFITAGVLLFAWCVLQKENIWNREQIKVAAISGILLLFIGNGAVIWAEQTLPSSLVAVLISSSPLWFVILDKPKWKENFKSRETIIGLIVGFIGVLLLFSERTAKVISSGGNISQVFGLIMLIIAAMSWSGGSLYSKYKFTGSASVNSAWQMLAAGIAFLPASLITHEWSGFQWHSVTTGSWLSVLYLVIMGSLAGYSAYVWLLQVRPATQVSTYAYVNPVVAVLLGVFFAGENMSWIQITGLTVILTSVLLINLAKYRHGKLQQDTVSKRPSEVNREMKMAEIE
jgi:drug/metabolite transporter (DMT)-like permease